ncbi:hypothetical protein QTH89_26075 [Variovorax sp. J22G21]|uniref:hypothetical protein n=1 Tax=Variovorax fucosicus TaxID=3053517 RepID=UPI0025762FBA|nr:MULTISPECIES: hypothetical protein [unclassified Variovorax]MDM0042713.1 hypothetical protein [Variovorax sp. J22R193]MDM0064709.1 hypothetical protein [Variovorax sp. J22G21]
MPKTGHFVLHSNVMPPLTAGAYELVSEQTGLPFAVAPEHTHVTVAAPRYVMPTDQILSTFPPANAEGAFGDRLPQIVLKRRTLPWERNPAGQVQPSPTPWLALVVVAEGEAQLSTATAVAQCVTAGTTLLDAQDKDVEQGLYLAVTETVVKKIFPCLEDLALLTHVREVDVNDTELANGDDDGWLAVVLANRLPVFDAAKNAPVRYMACLVNLEGQLAALPPPEPFVNHFEYALAQDWSVLAEIDAGIGPDPRVMGGVGLGNVVLPGASVLGDAAPGRARAPRALQQTAHASPKVGVALDGAQTMTQGTVGKQWANASDAVKAVALDPDAKKLVRDTMGRGFRFPIETFAIEKVLRFPVLAHWSFTTNEGATFETLMQDLDVGLLGTVPEPAPANAAPAAGPGPEVVQTGHIGLGHRTRRGDPVRAWYRGPCVPFPTTRDAPAASGLPPLAHSADQLRRIVPDGREDLALAAAFEIGRLLGLSQLSVVSALMRFRSEQFGAGRVRELLMQALPYAMPELSGVRIDLGRFVALEAIGEMVKNPDKIIGPRRPIADPGREIAVKGELDVLIAAGLGIDLEVIRKTGDQIGLLAAIAQTRAPVASEDSGIRFDTKAVAGLRNALRGELDHALGVAMPPRVAAPPVRAGARAAAAARAAPPPDALDALIAGAEAQADSEEEDAP